MLLLLLLLESTKHIDSYIYIYKTITDRNEMAIFKLAIIFSVVFFATFFSCSYYCGCEMKWNGKNGGFFTVMAKHKQTQLLSTIKTKFMIWLHTTTFEWVFFLFFLDGGGIIVLFASECERIWSNESHSFYFTFVLFDCE